MINLLVKMIDTKVVLEGRGTPLVASPVVGIGSAVVLPVVGGRNCPVVPVVATPVVGVTSKRVLACPSEVTMTFSSFSFLMRVLSSSIYEKSVGKRRTTEVYMCLIDTIVVSSGWVIDMKLHRVHHNCCKSVSSQLKFGLCQSGLKIG
jgi:hypothetical protein